MHHKVLNFLYSALLGKEAPPGGVGAGVSVGACGGGVEPSARRRKTPEEATAATARSAREIELVKTIYELKHTINR